MRRLLSYSILVFMMYLAASCGYIMDDGTCPEVSKGGRALFFRIELDEQTPGTKADDIWGNPYEDEIGTDFDSRIRPDAMFVVIYGPDNKVKGTVYDLSWWLVEGSDSEYEFMGDISHLELNTSDIYKVAIYANTMAPSHVESLDSQDGPARMWFDISDVDAMQSDSYIPMWGLVSTRFTLAEGQQLGNISLLRAVSKVRVRLTPALQSQGFRIMGAKLNTYNRTGFCLPSGWYDGESTLQLYQQGCFRPYSSQNSTPLPFEVNADGTEAIIYMPELETSDIENPVTLTISDASDMIKDYHLQFRNYTGGLAGAQAFDIVRNHIYDYTISQIVSGKQLVLTCDVVSWDRLREDIDFTNDVVTFSSPIQWTNVKSVKYDTREVVLYDDTSIEAICSFRIDTPLGATWTASMIPIKGSVDAFSWASTQYGAVGADGQVRIKVNNQAPYAPEHRCRLRITVQTSDLRTIIVEPDNEFEIIQNSI